MIEDQNLVDLLTYARKPIVNQVQENEVPSVFVPDGFKLEKLETLLPQPLRKRARVGVYEVNSFVDYINLHKTNNTMVYVRSELTAQNLSAVGVLDDHAPNITDAVSDKKFNGAGWSEHQILFTPEKTPEWIRWNAWNHKRMSQVEFAAFIEDNLPDIQSVNGSPSGAEMLKMALNFEATYDKKFTSKVNNQSGGVTLEFISTDDKATVARMDVFSRFTTGLQVFFNADAFPLEARLKYKASNGELVFWYELIRPERVFLTACEKIVNTIVEQTSVSVFNGIPYVALPETKKSDKY